MARTKPRSWEGRRGGKAGPRSRPSRPHPRQGGEEDLIARLARLESVMMAIAAHLGIDPARPAPLARVPRSQDVKGNAARRGDGHREATAGDVHAVVRTVARHLSGRVKQYHPGRGYGFVVSPGAPGDVFFHRSDCRTDPAVLEPSATVTFDLVEMANGQCKAVNVVPKA